MALKSPYLLIALVGAVLWFSWPRDSHATSGATLLRRLTTRRERYIEDKYTVMISTFARDEALKETLRELARGDHPSLHRTIIVWHDPKREPPQDLTNLIASLPIDIVIRRSKTDSLNNRFVTAADIETRAVMSRDDDLCFGQGDVEFQFKQWQVYGRDQRMVGTAPREVIPNEKADTRYKYRMKDLLKYEIILTNAAFMDVSFLDLYWANNEAAQAVRDYVDRNMNCEDIAMNFFAANATGLPPLLVETRDPRKYYRSSGISSSPSHFQTRSKCYDDFLDLFGGMHLPSATEVVKRYGGEIRDFWDSIPPPIGEEREDKPSANEIKRMNVVASELEQVALTVKERESRQRKQKKDEERQAKLVVDLRAEIKSLKDEVKSLHEAGATDRRIEKRRK